MHPLDLNEHISNLGSLRDGPAFTHYWHALIKELGFVDFTYIAAELSKTGVGNSHSPRFAGDPIYLTTVRQDWEEHYVRNAFYLKDPIIIKALHSTLPIISTDLGIQAPELSDAAKLVLNHGRDFGVDRGITIPVHRPGEFAVMTVFSDYREAKFREIAGQSVHPLHILSHHFHHHCHSRLSQLKTVNQIFSLTGREREAIQWLATGVQLAEIAYKMNISEHTLNKHLSSVRSKLGAVTNITAVTTALSVGLVHY